jgi:hypothetical protein
MDGDALIIGQANDGASETTLKYSGGLEALTVLAQGGDAVFADTKGGEGSTAVFGINTTRSNESEVGVFGFLPVGGTVAVRGLSGSDAIGVLGESDQGAGVQGLSKSRTGVQGQSSGKSPPSAIGVSGHSENGLGVFGNSTRDWGVLGTSNAPGGVGAAGVASAGTGIYGESASGNAIIGHSSSRIGVYGFSTSVDANGDPSPSGVGVFGDTPSGVGIYGRSTDGLAGRFDGPVVVNGDFTVVGGAKSAAVPHPDGSHRRLYCVESPESWFEDFGIGKVRKGKGVVRLDRGFAAVIGGGARYHVFITPRGDSKGLYVSRQRREGFDVQEQQGGKSSIEFAYRVVARRKDVRATRLEKVKIPTALSRDDLKPLLRHRRPKVEPIVPPAPPKTRKTRPARSP